MKLKVNAPEVARRWAYVGILVGGLASIAGNVTSTVLTESGVHLAFRVPWAILWPVLVYIGIEVLTRTDWRKGWAHWGARLVLIGPVSMVAALVSYLHIHHLMRLSGEIGLAQAVGPLAIDGTLFGCTVVLLITRAAAKAEYLPGEVETVENVDYLRDRIDQLERELEARDALIAVPPSREVRDHEMIRMSSPYALADLLPAPVSPAPVIPGLDLGEPMKLPGWTAPGVVTAPAERKSRTVRKDWDESKARTLLLEGETKEVVAALVEVHPKTIQRLRKRMIDNGELTA
jgi:hypothetical protein